MASAEEVVDLIDEEDRVIGRARRRQVRAQNLLHREVAALVRNRRGEVYVHRRTATKDIYPSLYDMFVAGVVTSGEAYEEAIRRELNEELGIDRAEPALLFMHRYDRPDNNFLAAIFEVRWEGPVHPQPEEIAWGEFVPERRLTALIGEQAFVPDGLEVFRRYLEARTSKGPDGLDQRGLRVDRPRIRG